MSDRSVGSLAEERLMFAASIVGLGLVLLTAGCAGLQRAQPGESPRTGAAQAATVAAEAVAAPVAPVAPVAPAAPAAPPVTPPAARPAAEAPAQSAGLQSAQPDEQARIGATQAATVAVEPAVTPVAPVAPSVAPSKAQLAPKAEPPVARAPAKPPAPPVPTEQVRKQETVAQVPAKQAMPPPLDLKSLETRLKETKAIGVFTKLALKNQVDELLGQFRAFYQGRLKTTLAELRRQYDLLLMKVLALLQDADPPLAGAIVTSREAIWSILADPAKFSAI